MTTQSVDIFYSQMQRVLSTPGMLPKSAPAPLMLATIDKHVGKFKGIELAESGLREHLQSLGDTQVTRQDILDEITARQIILEEVVKGDSPWRKEGEKWITQATLEDGEQRRIEIRPEPDGEASIFYEDQDNFFEREGVYESVAAAKEQVESQGLVAAAGLSDTKFSQYQLAGDENYRELLLILPGDGSIARYNEVKKRLGMNHEEGVSDDEFRQLVKEEEQLRNKSSAEYPSPHWSENNVIAHIRFNDRIGPNGEKILHIEEVQSDWHQEGKKRGYAEDRTRLDAQIAAIRKEKQDFIQAHRKADNYGGKPFLEVIARLRAFDDHLGEIIGNMRTDGVPTAPFKPTASWSLLAMKRMIRYAAENGFDRITWTPGELQADRYDLSKQVEQIRYVKNDNGTYDVWASDKNGSSQSDEIENRGKGITPDKLPSLIGKDVADKIIADKGAVADPEFPHEKFLSGQDLRIGGTGMKGFYDQILTKELGKYIKPLGGKIEETRIGGDKAYTVGQDSKGKWAVIEHPGGVIQHGLSDKEIAEQLATAYREDNGVPVHSFPITPQLRNAALAGQPLYSKLPAPTPAPSQEPLGSPKSQIETVSFKRWAGNWNYNPEREVEIIPVDPAILHQDVPDLTKTADVQKWLLENMRGKEIEIEDTAEKVGIYRSGIEDSLKRKIPQRGSQAQREAYAGLDNLLRKAVYFDFEPARDKDKNRLYGQDVYYAAMRISARDYAVKFKIDIGKETQDGRYKDHKVSEIVVAPLPSRGFQADGLSLAGENSATTTILLNTLTAGVKPKSATAVLDNNKKPLCVYHGTKQTFTEFDPKKAYTDEGIYFSASPETASAFTINGQGTRPQVLPVYLNITNPLRINFKGKEFPYADVIQNYIDRAKQQGKDGLILIDVKEGGNAPATQYVAFTPSQIKSALGNRGTFDKNNPDIRYKKASSPTLPTLPINLIRADAAAFQARLADPAPVIVHVDHAAAAKALNQTVAQNTAALYYGGQVHVVASAIADRTHLANVLVHEELRHNGLRRLLAPKYDQVMAVAWKNSLIQNEATELMKGGRYTFDLTTPKGRSQAADEALAHIADRGVKCTALDKIVSYLRGELRATFKGLPFSDGEVRCLIGAASRRAVYGDTLFRDFRRLPDLTKLPTYPPITPGETIHGTIAARNGSALTVSCKDGQIRTVPYDPAQTPHPVGTAVSIEHKGQSISFGLQQNHSNNPLNQPPAPQPKGKSL